MEPTNRVETLLEEIVLGLEASSNFDLDGFLAQHPAEADTLRERVNALVRLGLLPRPAPPGVREPTPEPFPDRYELRSILGTGAMGQVFRAWDKKLEREVAIKFLEPPVRIANDPNLAAWRLRFLREARLAARLQHHGIAAVHDLGVTPDDRPYFTMRLVEGHSLEDTLRRYWEGDRATRTELTLVRRVQIVQRICETIGYAHANGVLHRDLKPSNVMLGPRGEVLVLDWGLARRALEEDEPLPEDGSPDAERRGSSLRTASGTVIGTPSYLAPEQARGERADVRSDVFGIGAVLVHLLAGRPPFWGKTRDEVLRRARECDRNDPRLDQGPDKIPRELIAIAKKALAEPPAQRYQDAGALSADLQAFLEDRQGVAWRDPPTTRAAKLARRRPAATAAVAIAFLGLVLGVALRQQVVLASERERLDLERRIVIELPAVRDLGGRYATTSDSLDYALWAREWLAKFRMLELDLQADDAGERVHARLAELHDCRPEAEAALRRGLYDLGYTLIRSGALYGWMEARDEPIPANPRMAASAWEPLLRRYLRLSTEDPGLIEYWPRFLDLIAGVEDDPWRREVWEAQLAWWRQREDRIGDLAERGEERGDDDLVWLGTIVLSVRGREAALPILERAAWQGKPSFWAHFELARVYDALTSDPDHVQKSIEQNLIATALNPDSAWAQTNLGKVLFDRATDTWNEAQDVRGPEHDRLLRNHDDDRHMGIDCYRRAIALAPSMAAPRSNLANAIKGDQPAEAEALFRSAIDAEPSSYATLVSYAAFLQEQGRPDDEMVQRDRLAECYPDRADVLGDVATLHNERGSRLLAMGKEEEGRAELERAVESYEAVLRLNPDSFYMEQNLGMAHLELGQLEEGLKWLERSVEDRAEDLGRSQPTLQKGDHISQLREVLSRDPIRIGAQLAESVNAKERLERLEEAFGSLLEEADSKP